MKQLNSKAQLYPGDNPCNEKRIAAMLSELNKFRADQFHAIQYEVDRCEANSAAKFHLEVMRGHQEAAGHLSIAIQALQSIQDMQRS